MTLQTFLSLAAGAVLLGYAVVVWRAWFNLHGERVVLCPSSRRPAAITVDLGRSLLGAIWGSKRVDVSSCTDWPERGDCEQSCVRQLRVHSESTRPKALAKVYFAHKNCAMCQRPIAPLNTFTLQPGFMNPSTRHVQTWDDVPAEMLPEAFASWRPLCMNCTLAETFRQRFPDRVTDRERGDQHG